MVPTVPVSVWNQIAVVVVFSFLLGGIGYFMVKMFSKAIADINMHYSTIVKENNEQWQKYFDARSEVYQLVNKNVLKQMEDLTKAITDLNTDFREHDRMERQALDEMAGKRKRTMNLIPPPSAVNACRYSKTFCHDSPGRGIFYLTTNRPIT
jgi:hypothetical protein